MYIINAKMEPVYQYISIEYYLVRGIIQVCMQNLKYRNTKILINVPNWKYPVNLKGAFICAILKKLELFALSL